MVLQNHHTAVRTSSFDLPIRRARKSGTWKPPWWVSAITTAVLSGFFVSANATTTPDETDKVQRSNADEYDQPLYIGVTESSDTSPAYLYDIAVRVDGLHVRPIMSTVLIDSERTVMRGKTARFSTYTNYPAFVQHGEIRIFADGVPSDARPLAVIQTGEDGTASWRSEDTDPADLYFVFRLYDEQGRFDESQPRELTLTEKPFESTAQSEEYLAFVRDDQARIRNIQMPDAVTITVTGVANPETDRVHVSGQLISVGENGRFAAEQIISRQSQRVHIKVDKGDATTVVLDSSFDIEVPGSEWFFVGQGDLTFITSSDSGPSVDVSGDDLSDGDLVSSRAAYYLSGKFGDGWKLTSSLDTGEARFRDLFSNIDQKDPRQLLRRLDSNEFYPTYGDDSVLIQDAPTQTGFYGRLERNDDRIIIGNYIANFNQTDLAQLDRGLFGALLDHRSLEHTSFGERKLQLTGFASDPGTLPARDEFRGTGGSLYFLNRQDITIGSERLRIEVRDRDSGLVLSSAELRPQEDYDIDYFQGRITLANPLASFVSDDAIVRQGSSVGNVPVLVVRYEFTPIAGDLDGYTLGARGSGWIGEHIRLGVTAQRETTETADQTLSGVDALLRYDAGTYAKAEFVRTEGPGFGQSNSVDGGLNFVDIETPALIGQSAYAYRFEFAVDFAEVTKNNGPDGQVGGYFENFDGGFSSNGQLRFSDTERWGVSTDIPISENTRVSAKYDELSTEANGDNAAMVGELTHKFNPSFSVSLAFRQDERTPGVLFNSVEDGTRSDAALQVDYKPTASNWSLYGFGQLTMDHDTNRQENNRSGVGARVQLSDKYSFAGEISGGNGGLGASTELNRRSGEGSESYIGYALLADRNDIGLEAQNLFSQSNRGTLTVGARQRLSSALSVFGENRIGHGGSAPSAARSFGLDFHPTEHWSFSGSFENGRVDDATTGVFRRRAATIGAGYNRNGLKLSSQAEARFEDGSGRDQKVWLFRNNISAELNPDLRILGRLSFAIADNEGENVRAADFREGVVGFAYRPVDNDRLNVLGRYNYFRDLGPVGQITQGGEINSPRQESQILSFDVIYDLTHWLTVGGKYGYRQGRVSLGRESNEFVSSDTHLGILRGDIHIVERWDILIEGRLLSNDLAGNKRSGVLTGIYRHITGNAKIGFGYSFTDISDDLRDQSFTSDGFFINLLGKY